MQASFSQVCRGKTEGHAIAALQCSTQLLSPALTMIAVLQAQQMENRNAPVAPLMGGEPAEDLEDDDCVVGCQGASRLADNGGRSDATL